MRYEWKRRMMGDVKVSEPARRWSSIYWDGKDSGLRLVYKSEVLSCSLAWQSRTRPLSIWIHTSCHMLTLALNSSKTKLPTDPLLTIFLILIYGIILNCLNEILHSKFYYNFTSSRTIPWSLLSKLNHQRSMMPESSSYLYNFTATHHAPSTFPQSAS